MKIAFDPRFVVLKNSFTKNYFWAKIYPKILFGEKHFLPSNIFFHENFFKTNEVKNSGYQVLLRSNQNALEIGV